MECKCIYINDEKEDTMNTGAYICSATGKECEYSACECYSDPDCIIPDSEESEKQ